jgi:hypothetical protein
MQLAAEVGGYSILATNNSVGSLPVPLLSPDVLTHGR